MPETKKRKQRRDGVDATVVDYSRARDAMFAATDTEIAPWYVVNANDKWRARLNCISHLLSKLPYEELGDSRCSCPSGNRRPATASRSGDVTSSPTSTDGTSTR